MKGSRQDQGHSASFRFPKPTLTLDTVSSSKLANDANPAQSAPVGTRQEKGIPPLYQAFDRYCDKLAEMMSSPTWRSQNPGPHIAKDADNQRPMMSNDDIKSEPSSNYEDATRNPGLKDDTFHTSQVSGQPQQNLHISQSSADEIQLGHGSEPIQVHSIYRFPSIPHTSTNGTYIIAASVPSDPARQRGNCTGETQGIYIPEVLYDSEGETAEKLDGLDVVQRGDVVNEQEKNIRRSSRHGNSPDGARAGWETKSSQLDLDADQLMKLDPAIESINHRVRSSRHRHQASPDGEERFRGLIERLKPQEQIDLKSVNAMLKDPAILKIGPGTAYRSKHTRSDSGYTSGASRPRTREQSRATNATSDTISSEALPAQDRSDGPNDSGLEKPSKNSSLNPAAQEFSLARSCYNSPVRTAGLPRSDVSDIPFLPRSLGMTGPFPPPQGTSSHQSAGTWLHPLADDIIPTMGSSPMQQGIFPILSGLPLQSNNLTGAVMPPPYGINLPQLAPALPLFSGLSPGIATSLGLGVSGIAPPPSLAAPGIASPFHQQLPHTISCNDPNHFNMGPLGSQPLSTASPMNGTPQPAAISMHAGPPAFLPKHVPKPKVPNRDLQQNWELVHELRRMHEPGYAQKCKEKQRKRFMKQLERGSQP